MMTVERDTTPACLDGPRETTVPRSLSRRHRTRSADTLRSRTRSDPQLTSAPPHHRDVSPLEDNLDSHTRSPHQNQQQQQQQQQHRCSTSNSGDSDHHRRYHSEQNIHHFHHHYHQPPRQRRGHHKPPHTRKHTHHRQYDNEESPSQCSRSPSHSSTSHSHPSLSNPSQSNPSQRSQSRSHSNPSHSHPSLCSPPQSGRSPTHSDTSHSHPSLSNLSESSRSPSLSNPSQPSRSRSHSSHSSTSQLSRSTSQCSPSLSGEQSPSQRRRSRSRLRSQSTTSTSTTTTTSNTTTTTSNTTSSTAQQPFRSTSHHSVPGPEVAGVCREMQTSLSLCGCGFLGLYHLGVASCLLQHGPSFLARLDRVAGASAGALVAALLVTAPDQQHVQASKEMVSAMAKAIRKKPLGALTPGFQLSKELQRLLDRLLPPDAHRTANGKLHISLTDVKSKQNEIVSDFGSREELIEALVASCHIPVYSGAKLPVVKGKHYCDGGLTDNLVRFHEGRTVTVSPFSGRQDIGPRDTLKKGTRGYYVNLHNQDLQVNFNNVRRFGHAFFPPRSAILQQYFELGHKDASHFLVREGLYEILKPGDTNPVVYESSV